MMIKNKTWHLKITFENRRTSTHYSKKDYS